MPETIIPESYGCDYIKPSQYGWFTMTFFILIWGLGNFCDVILQRCSFLGINTAYCDLTSEKQKNAVTYIMQFAVTSVVLVVQIYGSIDVIFALEDDTTRSRFEALSVSFHLLGVLYMWELIYRQVIGWPLLFHHFSAIIQLQLVFASFADTRDLVYIRFMTVIGLYATTEQISFIALFIFRLGLFQKWQSLLFKVSAVQTFIFKTVITTLLVAYYIDVLFIRHSMIDMNGRWTAFWKYIFLPFICALYATQVHAALILFSLAKRCEQAAASSDKDLGENDDDDDVEDQYPQKGTVSTSEKMRHGPSKNKETTSNTIESVDLEMANSIDN